ncbi:gamma-glutamyl-gamma-aminobutyrate hydrolase family protein [Nonomuraea sp. K274]|uniref:Gamma-glutamyl-gamma-aminobutyrate hydrolase family protein n=1 Tax=Nonomuraea cypriaca TaxID=1187855 RepID=A0A931F487_9ACTN|nr:gamma-glutamyl-gamma-aminobutyrate hydrolase family protein [Nonomuraea cypriaca]MBF8190613.1 gamma-glutamyl-gamma-aminobutyrate hydrolase family protein [Nonomuraea cypriaca]
MIIITAGDRTPARPYEAAIEVCGGIPRTITPSQDTLELPAEATALVLAGGASVAPARYESPVEDGVTVTLDLGRDRLEWAMLDQAIERGLPVLAICRGLQVVNVYFGGELHQDLTRTPYTIAHRPDASRTDLAHTVAAKSGRLGELFGTDEFGVNSIHKQGVKLLAESLDATVYSPDGLIEGLEHSGHRILAVQWHPEELIHTSPQSRALFTDLLGKAASV